MAHAPTTRNLAHVLRSSLRTKYRGYTYLSALISLLFQLPATPTGHPLNTSVVSFEFLRSTSARRSLGSAFVLVGAPKRRRDSIEGAREVKNSGPV
ncbi:hypothetical protein BT69DRAFT_942796 [Atractiella rhizophila]|nr:hypothetical protein BT69DRAFT_942796 [Atractiella rhizophila]